MKKFLFALSIAAVLLAGVSCKKDNVQQGTEAPEGPDGPVGPVNPPEDPPEYAAILGLWSEPITGEEEPCYVLSITEDEFIEKRIVPSSLELDELFYSDLEIYHIESFEKTTSTMVDGDVWKITTTEGGEVYIFRIGNGIARMEWWEISHPYGYYGLKAITSGLKMTYHFVPMSAVDFGLSVYWGRFDMHSITHEPGFDPNIDMFNNVYTKDNGDRVYYPGSYYKFPTGDVVKATYGGKWRMPTLTEWTELYEACNWEACKDGVDNTYKCFLARGIKPGYETESVKFLRHGYLIPNSGQQNADEAYYWSTSEAGGLGHFGMRITEEGAEGVALNDDFSCLIHPVWDPNAK